MKKIVLGPIIITLLNLLNMHSAFSADKSKYTISGISSGAFMANQMSTIFSSRFSGVATVAGGFYYCAENYLQEKIQQDAKTIGTQNLFLFEPSTQILSDTLNPFIVFTGANPQAWFQPQKGNPIYQSVAICMGRPEKAQQPTAYLKENAEKLLVDPLTHLEDQKVLIYHGKVDSVLKVKMQNELKNFYLSVGVKENNILSLTGAGSHNFPTDKKEGINCATEKVPYVAACDLNLAGKILAQLFDDQLIRTPYNKSSIYVVDQSLDLGNVKKAQQDWQKPTSSIAPYGYLYASDKCLNNPESCHLHVALHGCKMSDSYDEGFQSQYQKQVSRFRIVSMRSKAEGPLPMKLPVIEENVSHFGLLKFVMDSGYIDYGEQNDLMILFPQTWISKENFPYNPKGCWDWFGWTGSDYATNKGAETKWLMDFIQSISNQPKKHLLNVKPQFDQVQKYFPLKAEYL